MKPSAIRTTLAHLIAQQRPAFLWGAPGVGKSDVVKQTAKDLGLELRDVRLALLDPIDLKGFPVVDTLKKKMSWLAADFLPTKGKGILFLDELNAAVPTVQAASYQLILDRAIGDYKLPAGWYVMGAGNRAQDRAVVNEMPSALKSRFIHLDYDVNVDDWNEWAMVNEIHTDVRAFIRFRPNLLHSHDAATNPRSFPCPRTWKFVNDIYKSNLSQDMEFEMIKGTVGEGASAEFSGFVRLIKDLPTVDEVLLDPVRARLPASPAAMYALVTALDAKVTVANIARVMSYVERMPTEFQVLFIRSAMRRDTKLSGTKTYMDWGIKNSNVLV